MWVQARSLLSPPMAGIVLCKTCGQLCVKKGKTALGTQRWWCQACNVSRVRFLTPNRLHIDKILRISNALLVPGSTIRGVERDTRFNKNTITRYASRLTLPPCPCGLPALHRMWCSWRFERSPARQAMLSKTWLPKIPSWLRPALWVTGSESMHSRDVHTVHCQWKACPFPAMEGTTRCRQHANFYEFPMTMHDTALDLGEVWSPKNPHEDKPLVIGHRPVSTERLEASVKFMRQGYMDDRHRNAGDIGGVQSSPMMRHMGHGKGRGSSKTSAGRKRSQSRQHNTHRQSHDPLKRWSREALELEANRILGEEPLELDFIPEEDRLSLDDIYETADPSGGSVKVG